MALRDAPGADYEVYAILSDTLGRQRAIARQSARVISPFGGEQGDRMAPSLPHSLPEEAIVSDIRVYGADWCGVTRTVREYLTNARFDYEYFDIDRDEIAQRFVRAVNDGRRRFPLVVVEQQVVLQPTIAVLHRVLSEHAISPRSRQPYLLSAR